MRPVSLEQLRAFLTSIFVTPGKPRTGIEWLRSWKNIRAQSEAGVIAKPESKG